MYNICTAITDNIFLLFIVVTYISRKILSGETVWIFRRVLATPEDNLKFPPILMSESVRQVVAFVCMCVCGGRGQSVC
jgi:hypothetical protein